MERRGDPRTHLAAAHVRVPFEALWDALAEPLTYSRLFPHWMSGVERLGPGFYVGVGPTGERVAIRPRVCRATGVIDLEIVAPRRGVEVARTRLFPTGHGCLYVRVLGRREGEDEAAWEARCRSTDVEVEQARPVLEQGVGRRAA